MPGFNPGFSKYSKLAEVQDELLQLGQQMQDMRLLLRSETNLHARKLIFDQAVQIMQAIADLEQQMKSEVRSA